MNNEIKMEFPITMLGARGVGKTSMIAAMWNEFDLVSKDPSLELLPDEQTEIELKQRLQELKTVGSGPARAISQAEGIKGTSEPTEYTLDFYHTSSRSRLKIIFRDYPGAWLDRDYQKFNRIVNKLEDARVILIAIDVPALMDSPERNDTVNRPEDIAKALQDAFLGFNDQQRLVLFVLMRGERWLKENQGKQIMTCFDQRFSTVVRHINARKSTIGAVICPIQTLGSVRFTEFNAHGQAIFEKVNNEVYRPVDCDQPLRYAMAFMTKSLEDYVIKQREAANDLLKSRGWWERIMDSTIGIFGIKSEKLEAFENWLKRSIGLRTSVSAFSNGCKQDYPFRVLQSPELIGVKRAI